jgi:hypothetical protein
MNKFNIIIKENIYYIIYIKEKEKCVVKNYSNNTLFYLLIYNSITIVK